MMSCYVMYVSLYASKFKKKTCYVNILFHVQHKHTCLAPPEGCCRKPIAAVNMFENIGLIQFLLAQFDNYLEQLYLHFHLRCYSSVIIAAITEYYNDSNNIAEIC